MRAQPAGGPAEFHVAALEPRTFLSAGLPGAAGYPSIPGPAPIVSETVDRRGLTIERKRIDVEHRREFTEVVATFTDARPGGTASDYLAVIDWGDGQVTEGRVVANDAGGYDVVGSHSYTWGWKAIGVTVRTELGGELRKVAAASAAYVVPPPMAGLGRTFEPVAGRLFRGPVATYVGLDATMLDDYVATVSWGDGQSSEAELVEQADGSIRVIGTHTYLRPGPYDLRIEVRERSLGTQPWRLAPVPGADRGGRPSSTFNDVRSRAVVSAGTVEGTFELLEPMTGVPFSGVIGRFKAFGGEGELGHLRATVQWSEDGPEEEAILSPTADGRFVVKAGHVFVDRVFARATIRIYDDRLEEGAAQVALARRDFYPDSHLSVRGESARAIEGVEFSRTVGWITSVGSGTLWESSFKVTIQWGDDQTSPGRVINRGGGEFEVRGTHTYAAEGYDREQRIRVSVRETRRPLDAALPSPAGTYSAGAESYVDIKHGPIEGFTLHMERPSLDIQVGEVLKRPWALATITVSDPALLPGDFSGTIAWEDGTTWPVLFEHHAGPDTMVAYVRPQFATAGVRTGTLTVTGAGMTRTGAVEANVRTPLVVPTSPPPFAAMTPGDDIDTVKGTRWRGTVARFVLKDPTIDVSTLTAKVYWGDSSSWGPLSSSAGEIIAEPGGYYRVVASHTYAIALNGRRYDVSLYAGLNKSVSTLGREVVVRIDPTRLNAYPDVRKHFRQREEFTTRVGHFTSPDASARAGDFEAWIDWGDGTRSRGVITDRYGGGFDVTGTHTYAVSGEVSPTITVTGPGGTDAVPSWISLDRDPVLVTPTRPVVEGLEVGGTLATFIDEDGPSIDEAQYRVAHAALIDWGDGKVGMGLVEQLPDGTFTVAGDHRYANSGSYKVRLVVRRNERWLPGESLSTGSQRDGASEDNDVESEHRTYLFRVRVRRLRQTPEPRAALRSVPETPAPAPVRLDPRAQWLYSLTRIEF